MNCNPLQAGLLGALVGGTIWSVPKAFMDTCGGGQGVWALRQLTWPKAETISPHFVARNEIERAEGMSFTKLVHSMGLVCIVAGALIALAEILHPAGEDLIAVHSPCGRLRI